MQRSHERIRDELLVLRCQDHDPEAFAELVAHFQGRLYATALKRIGNPDAARDAVQETWLAILRGLPALRDPARFPAFAHRILVRRCVDAARGAGRRTRLAEAVEHQAPRAAAEPTAELGHDTRRLRAALTSLPLGARRLLALRYRDELSVPEIACMLLVPEGTIKSRLHAARARLERALLRRR